MCGKRTFEKSLAAVLSVVVAVGMMPISVMAETGNLAFGEGGEIISFEELAPEVAAQSVPLGTSQSELNLPQTLKAEVRFASAEDAEESEQEEQVQDSEEPMQETESEKQDTSTITDPEDTSNEEDESGQTEHQDISGTDTSEPVTMDIPVTWNASPEYDGDKSDKYLFTPTMPENFALSDGVSLPIVTVTVGQAAAYGEITAFDALADELRWQNIASPCLPETVNGTVAGKSANIPVTWEADHEYNADSPAKGLYVFTAKAGNGYTVAYGVETPRITVYISALQRRLMSMAAGAGTSGNALEITTAAQLAEIATLVNAGRLETFLFNDSQATVYLTLGNDIDLSDYGEGWNGGKGWVPIGTESHHFKGMFDGGGNKITGLYINNSGLDYAGLFGYMDGSTVQNLGVADVNVTGGSFVGGVAGCVYSGGMTYCYTTGTVAGTGNLTGGVVGMFTGNITNCYASCVVTGTGNFVGGVVGSNNGDITNCYATGVVIGISQVGGVVGFNNGGRIQDCVALNLSVSGPSYVGRVTRDLDGTLSGNSAFSCMTVTENNAPKSIISDEAGLDGADMDAAVIRADGTLGGRFTAEKGWTVENGKLPGINETVEIPDYIADVSDPYFRGEGTQESPYQISTAAQLAKLAELVNVGDPNYNSKYYKLTADIDLSAYGKDYDGGQGWMAIGAGGTFSGTFDGGGHVISNLYSHGTSSSSGIGLFGSVEYGAIKNLGVTDVDIVKGNGGIVHNVTDGSITNCYSTGTVTGSEYVGGIVGGIGGSSSVTNCYSTCTVTGRQCVGGIVGNNGGSVTNCYSTGTVTGNHYVGGISGTGGSVTNCAALNPSISGGDNFGRVVGQNSGLSLGNCAFSGMTVNDSTVSSGDAASINGADKDAAAIAGAGFFQNLFGNDSAWIYADGKLPILAGFAEGAQDAAIPYYISSSYFGGGDGSSEAQAYEISTAAQLAKLAELVNADDINYFYGKFYKLTADIDLSGYNASNSGFNGGKGWVPIGLVNHRFMCVFDGNGHTITGLYINNNSLTRAGLFGYVDRGTVKNLSVTGAEITGGEGVGSVVGTMIDTSVTNCYVTGTVTGNNYVGGISGTNNGNISNCYSTCAVNGNYFVGGVVGENGEGVVNNCYSTGTVSGNMVIGGVVGKNRKGVITSCVALNPSVSGVNDVGRVVGRNSETLSGNYAFSGMTGGDSDKTTSGLDGADITVSQMSTASFWTSMVIWGTSVWDTAVWTIQDGKLPILKDVGGIQSGDSGLYLTKRDVQYATVTLDHTSFIYDGTAKKPVPTVTFDGVTLVENKDYELSITSTDGEDTSAGTQVGIGSMTISGKGNFSGAKSMTYTINKAPAPTLVWPVAAAVTYGDTLLDSALTGGSTAYGSFAWTDGNTVPTVENSGYSVTFTPDAATAANYEVITETTKAVEIIVNKAPAPTLVWPAAAAVTYGAKLSDSALTGGSTAYGSFAWTDGDTVPTVENSGYSVTFTPSTATLTSYENIIETTKAVQITVNKAPAPTLVWPAAAAVTYGVKLSDSALTGGSTAYGSFAWTDGDTVPTVENSGYSVTFTPSATTTANYEAITETTKTVIITVNKAPVPTLSPQIVNIYRGTSSTGNTIDLAALLPADRGTTSYSVTSSNTLIQHVSVNTSGTLNFDILSSDSVTTENVTVEAEMQNYQDAVLTVTVSFVDKKVPVVTPSVSGSLSYGQPLSTLTIDATALADNGSIPVSGSIAWNEPTCKPAVGAPAQNWTFTPSDTTVYDIVTGTIAITVNKATPQGTPATTQISIPGKTLSDAVLTGSFTNLYDGSPVPGTLRWDLPDTTEVTHGTAYGWTFTPGDTVDYSVRTGSLTPYPGSVDTDSSSRDSSDSDSSSTAVITSPKKRLNRQVTVSVPVTATAGVKGMVGTAIPNKVITNALAHANSVVKAQGRTSNNISLVLNIIAPKGSTSISATLSQTALKALVDAGVSSLKINGLSVIVSLDQKALRAIRSQSLGNVTITVASWHNLSSGAKAVIGTRPVYKITVGYTKSGNTSTPSNLSGGTATVSIPYTPAKGESAGCLYAVHVDGKGNASRVSGSAFDANSGCLIFTIRYFSIYGIGYTAPSAKFTGISKHSA